MIYRLYINNTTIYIGKTTNMKNRYRSHKNHCYNENTRDYHTKKSISIRQLGITGEDFKDYVKYEILYENIPRGYEKIMENLIIQLYRESGVNLWNEVGSNFNEKEYYQEYRQINKEKLQKYHKEYNKKYNYKKIQCPQCNLEMNKKSLSRHQRRRHKTV